MTTERQTQTQQTDNMEEEVRTNTTRWLESVGIPSDVPMPPAPLHDGLDGRGTRPPAGMVDRSWSHLMKPPRFLSTIACGGALPKMMVLVMALPS